MTNTPLSLSTRVNRLFETGHARAEPERTNEAAAEIVEETLRRPVALTWIEGLRKGEFDDPAAHPDPAALAALAESFGVDPAYLTGPDEVAAAIDQQMRLLRTIRDAGVEELQFRGGTAGGEGLAEVIEAAAQANRPRR